MFRPKRKNKIFCLGQVTNEDGDKSGKAIEDSNIEKNSKEFEKMFLTKKDSLALDRELGIPFPPNEELKKALSFYKRFNKSHE